jgi:hypothetical protein
MHAETDTVLGSVIHQAYCANLYRRASNIVNVRFRVWICRFDAAPVLMPFAKVVLAVGQRH